MLSTPGVDFEGGTFSTLEPDGTLQTHPFERGDLIIFNSHKYHCVQPVTSGERRVLVCELWEGLPRRCARRCRTPWGPCECAFAPAPPIYRTPDASQRTDIKPCLRLMTKSRGELSSLLGELGGEAESNDERNMVGAHAQWVTRQALDKERKRSHAQAQPAA